ncbi:hypothetical protein DLM45_03145 [Hyphomicrobium methylovorum]|uniref:hypothetical protein n=1 Tax=Hyphomicrobium methylovorum TaxID=84 RepID=UPI0015E6A1B6|nr:hypothetical protein [Hyphomicrobium methylovorum]MBA2125220.1 hypothetical protein [Hyphomicrobium methylovorum]
MTGLAGRFFASALIYAVLGMSLGLLMGITKDHTQMPTHAHLLLIGWVSFTLIGFFYHLFPERASSRWANVHFWLAQASILVLIAGLAQIFAGYESGELFAAVGSIGLLISTVLFAIIAWPAFGRGHAPL